MSDSSGFGEEVKRLRAKAEMSRPALGQLIGVNQSFIQKLESGERARLGADVYLRLCRALGVSCQHFEAFLAPAESTPLQPAVKPKRGRPKKA